MGCWKVWSGKYTVALKALLYIGWSGVWWVLDGPRRDRSFVIIQINSDQQHNNRYSSIQKNSLSQVKGAVWPYMKLVVHTTTKGA